MPSIIRRATEDDLPRLIELYQQLSLDDPREDAGPPLPDVYRRVFRQIDADPNQYLLVAEADGEVAGSVTVIICANLSYRGKPWAEVENVVVDEVYRRRGVGESLMREAIEIARGAGCYKITLTTNKRRKESHRFYERLGFAATHEGFRINL